MSKAQGLISLPAPLFIDQNPFLTLTLAKIIEKNENLTVSFKGEAQMPRPYRKEDCLI